VLLGGSNRDRGGSLLVRNSSTLLEAVISTVKRDLSNWEFKLAKVGYKYDRECLLTWPLKKW